MDNGTYEDLSMPRHVHYSDVDYALSLFLAIVILPGNILVILSVANFNFLKRYPISLLLIWR